MTRFKTISAAAVLLGTFIAGSASAETLVIVYGPLSNTPSTRRYNDDNPTISLKAGEEAVISYDDGSSDEIQGPYSGPLKGVARTRRDRDTHVSRAASAYRDGRDRRDGVASSRTPKNATVTPEGVQPLDINLDKDELQCFYSAPLRVWRADASKDSKIVLSKMGGGSAIIDIPVGSHVAGWPAGVGISGDGHYIVSHPENGGITTSFKLHALTTVDSRDEITMATLIDEGCVTQVNILADLAANR